MLIDHNYYAVDRFVFTQNPFGNSGKEVNSTQAMNTTAQSINFGFVVLERNLHHRKYKTLPDNNESSKSYYFSTVHQYCS